MHRNIPTLPTPCGSAKTGVAVERTIDRYQQDKKTVFVLPISKGIEEVKGRLIEEAAKRGVHDLKITAIYAGAEIPNALGKPKKVKNVTADVIDYIQGAAANHPDILLITHEAFKRLPRLTQRKFWALVCDEEVAIYTLIELNIAEGHGTVTEHIEHVEVTGGVYALRPTNRKKLTEVYENRKDCMTWAPFKELCSAVLDERSVTLVPKAQWDTLLDGTSEKGRVEVVDFLSDELFEGWEEVLQMAAFLDRTLQAKIHERLCGTRFFHHPDLIKRFKHLKHTNGRNLTIYYATDGKGSKSYLGKECAEEIGKDVFDRLKRQTAALFGKKRFAWVANKNRKAFDENHRIPCVSPCVNGFRDYTSVALMMCNNPKPGLKKMLELIGLSEAEIRVGFTYMPLYQSLMRTNVRNAGSRKRCAAVVVDKGFADFMAELMPGCTVLPLPSGLIKAKANRVGAPNKSGSDEERAAARKEQVARSKANCKAKKNEKASPHEQGRDHHPG